MRKPYIYLLIALFLCLTVLVAVALGRRSARATEAARAARMTATLQAADGFYHEELLKGAENSLVMADETPASVEAFQSKKYTFIYFSAHWCPPCRQFTPELVRFYTENSGNGDFELLFVSNDQSQQKMFEYMKGANMPWIGLRLDNPKAGAFMKKYKVKGIPCLVLLNEKDEVIASSYNQSGVYEGPHVALRKYKSLGGPE